MVYTDYRLWLLALFGFIISTIFNANKSRLKIPDRRLAYIFLTFNFMLLLWNASFTTNIARIATRSSEMNGNELAILAQLAYVFTALAIIFVGYLVGEVLFAVIQGYKDKKKGNKQETNELSERLDSLSKEIKGYRKDKDNLENFFNNLQEDQSKEQEDA